MSPVEKPTMNELASHKVENEGVHSSMDEVKESVHGVSACAVEDSEKASQSDDEDDECTSHRYPVDSGLLPFPEKLMALLDGGRVSDVMWWLPDGDSFCLVPSLFAEKVLDQHFSGTKFESFTRKLNRWYVTLI